MCTDALLRRLGVFALVAVALASVTGIASAGVPVKESRAALVAAERVEREMRKHGALESSVRGCWHAHGGVDCAAMIRGNDGTVKWRCFLQIRVERRGSRLTSKLTDAICAAQRVSDPAS